MTKSIPTWRLLFPKASTNALLVSCIEEHVKVKQSVMVLSSKTDVKLDNDLV